MRLTLNEEHILSHATSILSCTCHMSKLEERDFHHKNKACCPQTRKVHNCNGSEPTNRIVEEEAPPNNSQDPAHIYSEA